MKRLLSVLLVLLLAVPVQAFCVDNSKPQTLDDSGFATTRKIVTTWLSNSTSYLSRSANGFQIGDRIPSYRYDAGTLTPFFGADYYPIFTGEHVIGILTVSAPGTENETYAMSKAWAEELDQFISENPTNLNLVLTGNQIFLKSGNRARLAQNFYGAGENDSRISEADVANALGIATRGEAALARYNLPLAPSTRSDSVLLNVWEYGPQKSNECWAIAVKVSAEFLNGWTKTMTPEQICAKMGVDMTKGGYPETQAAAFKTCFGINARVDNVYSNSQIKSVLENSIPPVMSFDTQTPYGKAHAMCLVGFTGGGSEICLMDSNIGDFIWMVKGEHVTGQFAYQYAGYTMKYVKTVRPTSGW